MQGRCYYQMNNIIPTQTIITSNFVKYNRLSELILHLFEGSKATSLNLYLDLYGVMKTLFSDSYRTDISDYTAATSTILNMCGHYKSFFKGLGVSTKIYLIFSYNVCEINRKFVAEYNSKFFKKMNNKMISEMVELNNNLLETICPFLPDIYFLKTEFESSVLIDHLIMTGNENPNLIISKDIYPIQLTSLHPNTAFIKPKKLNGEDVSLGVSPRENINHVDDFWSLYCMARGASFNVSRQSISIHPINFSLLAALTRFPERCLDTLINITSANKLIFETVGLAPIKLSTSSLTKLETKTTATQIADARHKALDVEYFRNIFNESIESKMINLTNLNDPASVNMICSEYFQQNPVDLTRL